MSETFWSARKNQWDQHRFLHSVIHLKNFLFITIIQSEFLQLEPLFLHLPVSFICSDASVCNDSARHTSTFCSSYTRKHYPPVEAHENIIMGCPIPSNAEYKGSAEPLKSKSASAEGFRCYTDTFLFCVLLNVPTQTSSQTNPKSHTTAFMEK